MKRAWFIMLVSAVTNGGLTMIAGVTAILMLPRAPGAPSPWTWEMIVVQVLFGVGVGLRYIASQLKMTPEISAALLGKPVVTLTQTPGELVKITPTETTVATPTPKGSNDAVPSV